MRGLLLAIRRYSFKDDDGKKVEGAKVIVDLGEAKGDDIRGRDIHEIPGPLSLWDECPKVNESYEFGITLNTQGKVKITVAKPLGVAKAG